MLLKDDNMGFDVSDNKDPEDISDIVSKGDYVRVKGNSSDSTGRVKAINPQIVLLQPHLKQQPNGNYKNVDTPKQVPVSGHTVEQITKEHYESFEKTHVVNHYLDQPVHVKGKGQGTIGVLRSFYMNKMSFKPYLTFSPDEKRIPVNKTFRREYSEDMTIQPVPESMLCPDNNIVIP